MESKITCKRNFVSFSDSNSLRKDRKRADICYFFLSLSAWATASWWLTDSVVFAPWWAVGVLQSSVSPCYCCSCSSPSKPSSRTTCGCRERLFFGKRSPAAASNVVLHLHQSFSPEDVAVETCHKISDESAFREIELLKMIQCHLWAFALKKSLKLFKILKMLFLKNLCSLLIF